MHFRLVGGPIVSSLALLSALLGSAGPHPRDRISVTVHEEARRVDVSIDGQPFTSYIWPDRLAKPVLYPLRTANGTIITRGYPLEPRPDERVDHPHHVGMWLNYENVNGIDFLEQFRSDQTAGCTEDGHHPTPVNRRSRRRPGGGQAGSRR